MARSFFGQVTKYTPSAALDPRENRLTESFAATLAHTDGLARAIVRELFGVVPPDGPVRIRTQRLSASGGFVDLELAFGDASAPDLLVWVEVKHGADLGSGQLEAYAGDLRHEASNTKLVLLAPRESMPVAGALAVGVEWEAVAAFLRRWLRQPGLSEVSRFLVGQFIKYLKEERLSDEEALTPAHVFSLAARRSSERTLASLVTIADRRIAERWGAREASAMAGGTKPAFGIDWWATHPLAPPGREAPPTWRGAWFDWGVQKDKARSEGRDGYAFVAGATFHKPKESAFGVEGNAAWFAARSAEGFEKVSHGYTRLWRYRYPEQLLVEQTLELQADALAKWVVESFQLLFESPPVA